MHRRGSDIPGIVAVSQPIIGLPFYMSFPISALLTAPGGSEQGETPCSGHLA